MQLEVYKATWDVYKGQYAVVADHWPGKNTTPVDLEPPQHLTLRFNLIGVPVVVGEAVTPILGPIVGSPTAEFNRSRSPSPELEGADGARIGVVCSQGLVFPFAETCLNVAF